MNELVTTNQNDLLPIQQQTRDEGRAIEEVRGAIIIAKKFPRDESEVIKRVLKECSRTTLAEKSCYSFKRGNSKVTGPSVHLLKAIARHWGNVQCGVRVVEQRDDESLLEAYAWDMESNYRPNRFFVVKHLRYTKDRGTYALTDPRDIYEMESNQGARRLRACLQDLIPRDILDMAVEKCEETMRKGDATPIEERLAKMLLAFEQIGIDKKMIENYLDHDLKHTTQDEIADLQKVFLSIKDGHANREDFFELKNKDDDLTKMLNDKILSPDGKK